MNIPNRLTLFRIFLVPIVVLIYLFPYAQFQIRIVEFDFGIVSLPLHQIIVLILFIIASLTDFLDGYIARRDQLVTTFGKFADPIADKLLVNTMFILFAISNLVPALPIIIMIWRDIIVDGLRMTAMNHGVVVAAGFMGKLKTVLQMFTIVFLLLNNLPFELIRFPMSEFLLWLSMFISVFSGVSYFLQLKSFIFESK